jgi:hypothetical protein
MPGAEALAVLQEQLKHPHEKTRLLACETLYRAGHLAPWQPVAELLLQSQDSDISRRAAAVLLKARPPEPPEPVPREIRLLADGTVEVLAEGQPTGNVVFLTIHAA